MDRTDFVRCIMDAVSRHADHIASDRSVHDAYTLACMGAITAIVQCIAGHSGIDNVTDESLSSIFSTVANEVFGEDAVQRVRSEMELPL